MERETGRKAILGDPAAFTISCMPKGKETAKKAPGDGAKDKGKEPGGGATAVAKSE